MKSKAQMMRVMRNGAKTFQLDRFHFAPFLHGRMKDGTMNCRARQVRHPSVSAGYCISGLVTLIMTICDGWPRSAAAHWLMCTRFPVRLQDGEIVGVMEQSPKKDVGHCNPKILASDGPRIGAVHCLV